MTVDCGEVVNPVFLARSLQLLPQHDEKSAHKLLNPDDPQDVPRAIDLIEALISLRDAKTPTKILLSHRPWILFDFSGTSSRTLPFPSSTPT
jgi:hypothetical protein